MPHKKQKKPPPKPAPPPPRKSAKAAPKEKHAMTETPEIENRQMPEPGLPVTQTTSTSAGPFAQMDEEAQEEVQRELNLRVAREAKVPFQVPKIPPGLTTPNEIVAWASAHGTVGGAAAAGPPEGDPTQTQPPPNDIHPIDE